MPWHKDNFGQLRHARHNEIEPKAKSQDGLVCACLRSGNPYFSETTCRLLATEKIPGKELARMPARFLSSSLLTTLSRATRQFFTHGLATRVEHGCIEAVTK